MAAALFLSSCASQATVEPSPVRTSAPVILTQTLAPTRQPTPQVSSTPAAVICSPLAVQPLEKLAEIITQPFIMPRIMPDNTYGDDGHHGLDLGYYTRDGELFTGTPVYAAIAGRVSAVINDRPPYGNMVMVETQFEDIPGYLAARQEIPVGNSLYTLYAHMQNLKPLKIGQELTCGQQIGETGLTGMTGGPHLHFETRWGPAGTTFLNMAFYRADQTPEEVENYKKWRMSRIYRPFDPFELLLP